MIAASIYAACRIHGQPRLLKIIAKTINEPKKTVFQCYRVIYNALEFKVKTPTAKREIPKIIHKLKLSSDVERKAISLIEKAESMRVTSGQAPSGLAAAAIYIACRLLNERVTQSQIANAAQVTEVTIRNRYKGLEENLNLDINPYSRGRIPVS